MYKIKIEMEKAKYARFPKGSDEAKEYMASIREQARIKREAILNGEIEAPPKKEKKQKKIKITEKEVLKPEPEPEPEQEVEPEPEKPKKKQQEKPIIIKVPPKQQKPKKKIIIEEEEEEEEEEYEVEYRKPVSSKRVPILPEKEEPKKQEKQVIENIKDKPIDNPLLSSRVFRNK